MQKIILIAGPTGSGKSEIALRLAKKIDGEIINADSMQVYKEIKLYQLGQKKFLMLHIIFMAMFL